MSSGTVLDFSNNRLQEFVEDSTRLNIYDSAYNLGTGSKANRLRGFWSVESDEAVGKLLGDLLDYGAEMRLLRPEDEQLIDACWQTVARLSPQRAAKISDPRPDPSEKLQPIVHNIFNGPIGNLAQNSQHFNQTANIQYPQQDLLRLVSELTKHLDELKLDPHQRRRVESQIATLETELAGEPDPTIIRQAGRTIRNITEGAIGSLLATAVQPTVWQWIRQMLASFGAS